MSDLNGLKIPAHVAIILDGNGRWAKAHGVPRSMGHKQGCTTLEGILEDAARMGIQYLTVYAFSTENWKRSAEEVDALMQLFRYYTKKILKKILFIKSLCLHNMTIITRNNRLQLLSPMRS